MIAGPRFRINEGGARHEYPPKDESWMPLSNCLGLESDLFFPGRGDDVSAAKTVCRGCVVRQECLDYALTPPYEFHGVWGGYSERERRRMRQGARA